jgi:hypothetical protein
MSNEQGFGQARRSTLRRMPANQLHVVRWEDPVVEATGFPARSSFVEIFWLPVLGPSATALLWRLQLELEVSPRGCSLDLNEFGRELGLGTCDSKHAPLHRAILRLVRFGLAKRTASGRLAVRSTVWPLSDHELSGLGEALRIAHGDFLSRVRAGAPDPPANGPSPTAGQTTG